MPQKLICFQAKDSSQSISAAEIKSLQLECFQVCYSSMLALLIFIPYLNSHPIQNLLHE